MVQYIAHRQNKLKGLKDLKKKSFSGIELDLRSESKNIVLHHDPFRKALEFFKNYNIFKNKFLIADIKSSGICLKINNYLIKRKAKFLLLNLNQPELIEMIDKGFAKNLFLRFSFYEKLNLKKKKLKKIKWIWVDFLENYKISLSEYKYLKKFRKKICLTSPDLVGLNKNHIKNYINYLNKNNIKIDMVCVKEKNIKIWKRLYKY